MDILKEVPALAGLMLLLFKQLAYNLSHGC